MSEDYLAQAQPTQSWNTARGVWEKQGIANLLCEHWELFSETWQISGSMRNGKVYELPTQALPTTDSESLQLLFLPTITTQDGENNGGLSQHKRNTKPLNAEVLHTKTWGKFGPAIRRWEQILGRPSPLPTKPAGKDGAHRLSSTFTEWMMGLPSGWVTGVGLTRNEELKACGNGVVPQQAELALRILLQGINLEAGPELFTPTLQTDNETIGGISLPAEKAGNNAHN